MVVQSQPRPGTSIRHPQPFSGYSNGSAPAESQENQSDGCEIRPILISVASKDVKKICRYCASSHAEPVSQSKLMYVEEQK